MRCWRSPSPHPPSRSWTRGSSTPTCCRCSPRSGPAFRSVYQPIVTLGAAEPAVVGYEALLRAQGAQGPVLPAAMFAAAERAGWTHVLDRIGRTAALRGAARVAGRRPVVRELPSHDHLPAAGLPAYDRAGRRARRASAGPAGLRGDRERTGQGPRPPLGRVRLLPGAGVQGRAGRPGRRLLLAEPARAPAARRGQAGQGDRAAPARAGQCGCGGSGRRHHPRVRRAGAGRVRRDRRAGRRRPRPRGRSGQGWYFGRPQERRATGARQTADALV